MQINTALDFNLIAVEQQDTVHLMLELTAPKLAGERRRDPATLQIVLDRSGSMAAGSLLSALEAIDSLLGRLAPEDRFGLVTFDDEVQVPVAAGRLEDAAGARQALRQVHPGGMTNLGGGLLRGIQEAHRVSGPGGATLVLLSDGHANQGVVDHTKLGDFASGAARDGIATSTIGIGLGYDEDLLDAVARGGQGNAHFAEHGDEAGAHLASEVDGLLEQSVQALSLAVRPTESVSEVRIFNDLPTSAIEGGFMVELGDLNAGETRRVLLEVDVPAIATLGAVSACELELRWVEIEAMESKVAKLPVNVNVVPGDQAAGRVADPTVEVEVAFQRAQQAKRAATDALRDGDVAKAADAYRAASSDLSAAREAAPSSMVADLDEEIVTLENLSARSRVDAGAAAKVARADYHRKARRRGRD